MSDSAAKAIAVVVDLKGRALCDEEIVRGLVRRDPRAAAALYDRYGAGINRRVWLLLGGDPEHDDVVHQVFVNVLGSIGKLESPSSLEGWITRITINTVRRTIRSRKVRRILVPVALPPEVSAAGDGPESGVLVKRFYEVLRRMRTEDHLVFALRFVEGYSLAEVSAATGLSLATVKRRIARAKREFARRAATDPVLGSLLEGRGDG